ncbi:MAG TPA: glycosyltransferase [Candidatus Micrarchaeaceae archaeon]|nr:glycosyltransferase [Candidatus Micrarchaeaceae archaeon]
MSVAEDKLQRSSAPALRDPTLPRRVMLVLQSTSVGGMETHCVDIAAELVHRGVGVIAIVPESDRFADLSARFLRAGAHVQRLDTDGRRGRAKQARRLLGFGQICMRWRPDVVHVHTGGATGGLAVVLSARYAAGAMAVITEHDVPVESPSRHQRLARWTMDRQAHAIIAVSKRNARLRADRLATPPHKLVSILNGVPVEKVSQDTRTRNRREIRAEMGIESQTVVLGSLVRLAEGKGLHDLLRAFAIANVASSKLLLIGDGPLRAGLEALAAELGIAAEVRFAGHRAEPAPYLDAMDAFVLAVPAGSMSVALLEAMARGLPPVITFCGPEEPVLDGVTGLCAPPSDPGGLAIVLRRLLADADLRESLGRGAAAHTRRKFSIERVVDDLAELYGGGRHGVPARLRANSSPGGDRECGPGQVSP